MSTWSLLNVFAASFIGAVLGGVAYSWALVREFRKVLEAIEKGGENE